MLSLRCYTKENAAKFRDPNYLTWLANQRLKELLEEEKEELARKDTHKQWEEYEKGVTIQWTEKQKRVMEIEEAKRAEKHRIQQVLNSCHLHTKSIFTFKLSS